MKKFIKGFLEKINEGVRVDPNNPGEVIMTYSNLRPDHPEYDNEVLMADTYESTVTAKSLGFRRYSAFSPIVFDKKEKIKQLDHPGRPKYTMDLVKKGKISGGQQALNNILSLIDSKDKFFQNVKYVASLDSTGKLTGMMLDYFSSAGKSTLTIPKKIFTQVEEAINIYPLILSLIGSEHGVIKNKLINLKILSKNYKDKKVSIEEMNKLIIRHSDRIDFDSLRGATINKQTTILTKFFGALETAIDIPLSLKRGYETVSDKSKNFILKSILDFYYDYLFGIEKVEERISQLASIATELIKNVFSSHGIRFYNFKIRTSGTAFGDSVRSMFVGKYDTSSNEFMKLVGLCSNGKASLLIIDDNINSGADIRSIERGILDILENSGASPEQIRAAKYNIRFFVLYRFKPVGAASDQKDDTKPFLYNGQLTSISTAETDVVDFERYLQIKKIIEKIELIPILGTENKPKPSLPKIVVSVDQGGVITKVEIVGRSAPSELLKEYPEIRTQYSQTLLNPKSWNFPFTIGSQLLRNGVFVPAFEIWAKSIGLWANGVKYV